MSTVADRIRAEKVPCPDHPMPLPKPSCWTCGRNGAFERAARIAEAVGGASLKPPLWEVLLVLTLPLALLIGCIVIKVVNG